MKNLKDCIKNYTKDYIDENVNRLAIWDIEDNNSSQSQREKKNSSKTIMGDLI